MNAIKTSCLFSQLLTLALVVLIVLGAAGRVRAATEDDGVAAAHGMPAVAASSDMSRAWIALAAALTIGVSCVAAGYAVAKVGAAAMGAASEKPEIMGKAMLFVAIAEGIAIYGLIIAVFILTKI